MDAKKTGLLVDDNGNPIKGASGLLVDGISKTVDDAKNAASGIASIPGKIGESINSTVEDLKEGESKSTGTGTEANDSLNQVTDKVFEGSQDPDKVSKPQKVTTEDMEKMTDAYQSTAESTDDTDWKAKYDELSKQMNDLQKKYADRFTGQNLKESGVTNDVAKGMEIANEIDTGNDINVDDLFQDVTSYATGKLKQGVQRTFKANNDNSGTAYNPTGAIDSASDLGNKIGGSLRNAATSLPRQAAQAAQAGEFSTPGKIASGLAYGLGNAVVNNPVKIGIDDLFKDEDEER